MPLTLAFTADEAALLGHTADSLCVYLGKPVVAEIIPETTEDFEWALFAIPLDSSDVDEDIVHVQVGGSGARILASQGGLNFRDGLPLDCKFLWAIQISNREDARYIKVDPQGEEVAWSDDLADILPFGLGEASAPDDDLPAGDPE